METKEGTTEQSERIASDSPSPETLGTNWTTTFSVNMSSGGVTRPPSSVSFERQAQFSVSQDLCLMRSELFKLPQMKKNQSDVRTMKTADFSVRLFRTLLEPPTRRERMLRAKATSSGKRQRRTTERISLPDVSHQKKQLVKFITSFRPPDVLESELKIPPELYKNIKPHNFRPLDENIPDFVTSYDRDPGNLRLKLQHLDILKITSSNVDSRPRDTRTRMDTYKPVEPKWDAGLVLPQSSWPPKSASYTRHRQRRGAYSAFLDRVEEKLSRSLENTT